MNTFIFLIPMILRLHSQDFQKSYSAKPNKPFVFWTRVQSIGPAFSWKGVKHSSTTSFNFTLFYSIAALDLSAHFSSHENVYSP